MKNILIILVTLISFILPQDCEEPSEVWFKISNDMNKDKTYGKIIQLDMSQGYAFSDEIYIHLLVLERNTGEQVLISFPIGYWETEKIDGFKKFIPEENKEFDLEKYLKSRNGIEIENRVGD